MPSFTKWYFTSNYRPYNPSTWHGGWDTNGLVNRLLSGYKEGTEGDCGTAANINIGFAGPHTSGILRGISEPLKAQTISGTVNMAMFCKESDAAVNAYTKVFIWVTQGNSNTSRGTLLDYIEASGGADTEWPTTATGKAFTSAQTLTPLAISAGDRLVIEFGISFNHSGAYTATSYSGCRKNDFVPGIDLSVGNTVVTDYSPFFEFSNAIEYPDAIATNVVPENAILVTVPNDLTVTVNTLPDQYGWYKFPAATEDCAWGLFAGVNSAIGNYSPYASTRKYNGTGWISWAGNSLGDAEKTAYQIPVEEGDIIYFYIYAFEVPDRNLVIYTRVSPLGVTKWGEGTIFICGDSTGIQELVSVIINKTTGVIVKVIPNLIQSETGIYHPSNGNILFADKITPFDLKLFDRTLTLIDTITGVTVAPFTLGQTYPPVSMSTLYFYVGQYIISLDKYLITQLEPDGTLTGETWQITKYLTIATIQGIAVKRDDTKLYYTLFTNGAPVKVWDLVNDVALSDLYAGLANYSPADIYVFNNNYIIFSLSKNNQLEYRILVYDDSHSLYATYTFDNTLGYLDHTCVVAEELKFWCWWHKNDGDANGNVIYTLVEHDLLTGAMLTTLTNVSDFTNGQSAVIPFGDSPTNYFGATQSCPILSLLSSAPQPPDPTYLIKSGLYKITKGKRYDSIWDDSFTTSENLKIPNPGAKIGYIG